ncbi:MAG: hypothetical protein LLG45_12480 [Actinomycetia bacterium]|nr:hypothetical protein [Actinomycetes bacterium]
MTVATIIMIVLICLGCALAIAGLAVAGHYGYRTYKAGRALRIASRNARDEITSLMRGVEDQMRELETKQEIVAERLQSLSATIDKLRYLRDEIDRSTGYLSKLKS